MPTVTVSASVTTFHQKTLPLTIGELWAIPIMLRLALLENLRRIAARLANDRRDRDSAADWAERMSAVVEQNPQNLITLAMLSSARTRPSGRILGGVDSASAWP